jgi:ubiquinone/menaquinone biosynthesis C-methylase UbiE
MSDTIYNQKSQEQREYYNQTAQDYDKWHVDTPSAKVVDLWNFANLQNFLKGKTINKTLELGSGTGRLANSLLAISAEVYGVDQSAEVLKIAQNKYPKLNLSCAEVVNLPYGDEYFDLVIINGSLHHFFAVEETFKEAHRVLKKGGSFVLLGEPSSQFLKPYNPFFYFWLVDRVISKVISIIKKTETPPIPIEPDAESYKPRVLRKQLVKAGFEVTAFYTYDYFVRHNYKLFLLFYPWYLKFENKTLSKLFPYLGLAIQAFNIKK